MTNETEKRILVLGGAGKAGARLCQQALDAGYQVDCIVREPSKMASDLSGKVTIILGDLADTDLLAKTMEQKYAAVFSTVGIYHKTTQSPLADLTSNIITAMQSSGNKRFICMSSIGTEETKGQGSFVVKLIARFFLKHVLLDKSAQEKLIKASSLDWTIIRPPQLLDQDSHQAYVSWEGNQSPAGVSWKISNADATLEMLHALSSPDTVRKAYQISYSS